MLCSLKRAARIRSPHAIIASVAFVLLCAAPAQSVVLGQADDFEDGTTQGWTVGGGGHPAPPTNAATGGPAGAGDNFLLLAALGGAGPGSKLSAFNMSQWAGDYVSAGIHFIGMSLNNLGSTDLSLRLLFADPTGGPPSNVAISTDAVLLPAGGGWVTAYFPVDVGDLTGVLGNITDALTGATELRIFHNPIADFPVTNLPAVSALVGIDNMVALAAIPVPVSAPALVSIFAIGLLGCAAFRRGGPTARTALEG